MNKLTFGWLQVWDKFCVLNTSLFQTVSSILILLRWVQIFLYVLGWVGSDQVTQNGPKDNYEFGSGQGLGIHAGSWLNGEQVNSGRVKEEPGRLVAHKWPDVRHKELLRTRFFHVAELQLSKLLQPQ